MLVLFTVFFLSAFWHLQTEILLDENSQWCILVCNFFTAKHYQSKCQSRWGNLDHHEYHFQPIKFVKLVVPSPCETEPYNKEYYFTKLQSWSAFSEVINEQVKFIIMQLLPVYVPFELQSKSNFGRRCMVQESNLSACAHFPW